MRRRYHDHVVNVVGRLLDGIKAKGPDAAIDVSDIAQRESFDVIGMVRHLPALQQGPSVSHPDLLKAALARADCQDGFWMMKGV